MTGAERPLVAVAWEDIPRFATEGFIEPVTEAVLAEDAQRHSPVASVLLELDAENVDVAVLPWSAAVEVLVPDEQTARELLAREYDNFDPGELRVTVRPELFQDDDGGNAVARPRDPSLDDERLVAADRRSGAACGLLRVPVAEVDSHARDEAVAMLLDPTPTAPSVADALAVLLGGGHRELLHALVGLVLSADPAGAFGARAAIEALIGAVSDRRTLLDLERIDEVLRGKRDLPEFRAGLGRTSAKATLMLCSRPDPHGVLTWIDDAPLDRLTVALAAALVGARVGWARVPSEWRTGREWRAACEAAIADRLLEVVMWTEKSASPRGLMQPVQRRLELEADTGASAAVGDLRTLLADRISEPEVAEACAQLCAEQGWHDLVVTVVDTLGLPFVHESGLLRIEGGVQVHRRIDRELAHRWDPANRSPAGSALIAVLEDEVQHEDAQR